MIDLTKSVSRSTTSEKIVRGLWMFVVQPVVRWLPKSCSAIRVGALRLFGAKIGAHCLIERGVSVLKPWKLRLSEYVALGREVEVYNFDFVEVGRMTVISQYTFLCTGTHDYTHPHMPLCWKPIRVGSQTWIAAGVFVGPGTKIGDGVVVGARSVVIGNLSDWGVYGGNPARRIKDRHIRDLSPNSN